MLPLALEELADCASPAPDAEEIAMGREIRDALNLFLAGLPKTERVIFLRRYFLLEPAEDIAKRFSFTTGKVNSMLYRTRQKLKTHLTKEGYL